MLTPSETSPFCSKDAGASSMTAVAHRVIEEGAVGDKMYPMIPARMIQKIPDIRPDQGFAASESDDGLSGNLIDD